MIFIFLISVRSNLTKCSSYYFDGICIRTSAICSQTNFSIPDVVWFLSNFAAGLLYSVKNTMKTFYPNDYDNNINAHILNAHFVMVNNVDDGQSDLVLLSFENRFSKCPNHIIFHLYVHIPKLCSQAASRST